MITLSLLKYLENNGFGEIDRNLFWQKLSLDKKGIYITDLGADNPRGERKSLLYELYSRGSSDTQGYKQLQEVVDFLNNSFEVCELPAVPPVTQSGYDNVVIMPLSSIASVGEDANGRIIYSVTGRIYY